MDRSYRKDKELSDCGQCVRYLLITGNIFFWLISCAVVGVGVWIIVDKNYMSIIYGNVLMTVAAYLIVVAAGVMFLICGCGCIGAIAQSRALLLIYFCVLVGIVLFLFVGSILAIVYRTEIKNELQYTVMRGSLQKEYGVEFQQNPYNEVITTAWDQAQSEIDYEVYDYMRVTLQRDYGVYLHKDYNRAITTSWDKAQIELYCCGVEDQSWNVYRSSEWYKIQPGVPDYDKPYVPLSCCKTDQYGNYVNKEKCQTWNLGPPGKQAGEANEAVYYRGCYGAGRDFIMDFTAALIGMGIGVSALMIGAIVLAFMLYRMVDY